MSLIIGTRRLSEKKKLMDDNGFKNEPWEQYFKDRNSSNCWWILAQEFLK